MGIWLDVIVHDEVVEVLEPKEDIEEVVITELDELIFDIVLVACVTVDDFGTVEVEVVLKLEDLVVNVVVVADTEVVLDVLDGVEAVLVLEYVLELEGPMVDKVVVVELEVVFDVLDVLDVLLDEVVDELVDSRDVDEVFAVIALLVVVAGGDVGASDCGGFH